MLGIRNEIQTHSIFSIRLQNEANAAWQTLCEQATELGIEQLNQLSRQRSEEFSRIITYDNKRLKKDVLPLYRKMLTVFRDNYWLADPETRQYYTLLVEFVEIWNRWMENSLPREVLLRLNHREEKLQPLYQNLQRKHDEIFQKIKTGTP